MFKGSMVALVTPMHADGTVDKNSLCALIDWHIAAKTTALIVAGTTGESATLSAPERTALIQLAVAHAAQRIPVIAGTGSNCTSSTIAYTKAAQSAGADACLVVTPYYNKPTQKGLLAHYKTVAAATQLPVILYNVPGRTACDMLTPTVAELAKIENIIGLKDATGELSRLAELRKSCGPDFALYSGDDASCADYILQGGDGVISVTANLAPAQMQAMCSAALIGARALTLQLNAELALLHRDLFVEANPIPTKWALEQMGKIKTGIRLPLLPLDECYYSLLKTALQQSGILPA